VSFRVFSVHHEMMMASVFGERFVAQGLEQTPEDRDVDHRGRRIIGGGGDIERGGQTCGRAPRPDRHRGLLAALLVCFGSSLLTKSGHSMVVEVCCWLFAERDVTR